MELGELLRRADDQGLNDREIAELTGRNPSTIWRWRKKPPKAFIFDEGVRRLIEKLGQKPVVKGKKRPAKTKRKARKEAHG